MAAEEQLLHMSLKSRRPCFRMESPLVRTPCEDAKRSTRIPCEGSSNCTRCPTCAPSPASPHLFTDDTVRESQSKPSYNPSPLVAHALWMNHSR